MLQDAGLAQSIAVAHRPTAAFAKAAQPASGVALPKTATDSGTLLWRGLMMLLTSLLLALFALRQRRLAE
jgi:hypothetical protein